MRVQGRSIADQICRWLNTTKPAARSYEELAALMHDAATHASQGQSQMPKELDLNGKLDMKKPLSFAVSTSTSPQATHD